VRAQRIMSAQRPENVSIVIPNIEEQIALIEFPMKPMNTARRHDLRDVRSRMAIGGLYEAIDRVMADAAVPEKMPSSAADKLGPR
jgi:hypothetical protein